MTELVLIFGTLFISLLVSISFAAFAAASKMKAS